MPLDTQRTRQYLKAFDFRPLFNEELGWERYAATLQVKFDGLTFTLTGIAEKRGLVAFLCSSSDHQIPDYTTRRKIEARVTKTAFEHIIIYSDAGRTTQVWQWVKREAGKPVASREHTYHVQQPGEALIQKLQSIVFSLEEEESLTTVSVAGRVRVAFDVERITKRFYDRFKTEHAQFLNFIKGIPDEEAQRWYASVMINRLMFIYFIQKKGFLNGDTNYLRTRLQQSKQRGRDLFYSNLLCPLFFEGFAKKENQRSANANKLLGKVPYLNGGLFLKHQIEEKHEDTLEIPDSAFAKLFDFFDGYQWHLDERPLRQDNEINPDVLGYIFEKYINQKQMGAYYSKEDITGYIGQNTIIPFLVDKAREKCRIAFEGDHSIWQLLQADPDRYIYDAMKKGVDLELPTQIAAGLNDVSKRTGWNKQAPEEFALPTEIWREVMSRRKHYEEVRTKLALGHVQNINDLITYNLDIRQFAQDMIEGCEGPDLLNALWHATEKVTVLDPACGSGAFLFAALNILEPLYEACLGRMEAFLEEWGEKGKRKHPNYYKLFSDVLARLGQHPNQRYFILKSIIINNLFGVDIMEEATEICKLRLFLKLVAQIERDEQIEPLPDIDFNILAGNTLVGFTNYEAVKSAVGAKLAFDDTMSQIEEKAQDVDRLFALFRQQQTQIGGEVTIEDKRELRKRLKVLEDELNELLANDYGVKKSNRPQYTDWLNKHKPFNWFIEFHNLMKKGGFDSVIGNPPYIELNALEGYYPINYLSEDAGNIYALMLERSLSLRAPNGRVGVIVPVSSVSTDRYKVVQDLLSKNQLHYSSFDDRPSRLFEGLEHIRLTIHLIGQPSITRRLFSTRYNKWSSAQRSQLFATMRYVESSAVSLNGALPKLSCELEVEILSKLLLDPSRLSHSYSRTSSHRIFYSRKVGYFLQILDFEPLVLDGNGIRRPPSEFKELRFGTEKQARIALCCLNSNLFYWFITVASDCRHVNKREIDGFPINLNKLAKSDAAGTLGRLAESLMNDLQKTSESRKMRFKHDSLTVQCIFPKKSKNIVDAIDQVLAKHYGFTEEELDFIINYDIKYRMGLSADYESDG